MNKEIPYDMTCIDWINPFSEDIFNLLTSRQQRVLQAWKKNEFNQMPWLQYGFRDEMDKWIRNKLTGNCYTIEQVRSWEKGLLLKVHGHNDNYYVKTVPPIFAHEPFVHKSMPEYVPEIIAIHEEKNTYMMKEMKGQLLGYSKDIQQWKITAQRIASLQQKYIYDELQIKPIVPNRPIKTVLTEKQVKKTINSLKNYISHTSYQALLNSIPSVLSLVQTLDSKLPLSIDHGDLFGGNVIVENEEPLIYDWSNSSITHPFLSVVRLVEEVADFFSEGLSEEILSAYLCEWTDFGQIDELRCEFSIVRLLEPIYYLAVHIISIFPAFQDNVEKKEIIDGYVAKWVSNTNVINQHG
ncbi:phosphotransferase [Salicibibacter cibarius]|uniref:phosphotransferase n=1 Tax=Salicibibacter cibarius TaxID=2743000 RepID=UPI001B7D822D|nr:phosphotransferase [Salicibibacter cibarius]